MIKQVKKILSPRLKRGIKHKVNSVRSVGRRKFFCIGFNKTGTTSLKVAMDDLGYVVGHQRTGERLMCDWAKRDFERIIKYCRKGQFFQDAPFSKPYTYVVLDHEFPDSKFILTVRDSAEQWYNSLTNFHAKKWGKNGRVPIKEDLQGAPYIQEGWAWEMNRLSYKTPEDNPYKKDVLIDTYKRHNQNVKEYFRHRPDDLLVLNVAKEGAYQKLCNFLGVESDLQRFPWKNKTEEVKQ